MTRERIGFDRPPPARVVECYCCGLSTTIDKAWSWPSITVLPAVSHDPMYARNDSYDALGYCGCSWGDDSEAAQPEREPQLSLFGEQQ